MVDKIEAAQIIHANVAEIVHIPKDGQIGSTYIEDEDNEEFLCIYCGKKMTSCADEQQTGVWYQRCDCEQALAEIKWWKELRDEVESHYQKLKQKRSSLYDSAFHKARDIVIRTLKLTVADLENELSEKKDLLKALNES